MENHPAPAPAFAGSEAAAGRNPSGRCWRSRPPPPARIPAMVRNSKRI